MNKDEQVEEYKKQIIKVFNSNIMAHSHILGNELLIMSNDTLREIAIEGNTLPWSSRVIPVYIVMMIVKLCKRSNLDHLEILKQVQEILESEEKERDEEKLKSN